jgi:hypothetical protein
MSKPALYLAVFIGSAIPGGSTGRLMAPGYHSPYTEQFNVGYSWQLNSACTSQRQAS